MRSNRKMIELSESKQKKLIFVCFIMYASIYLAKLNYSAMLVEILKDLGGTRSAAGMVGSFFFFAYGVGQALSGFLIKRLNRKYVVTFSLFGSAVCNMLMSLAQSVSVMKYIWLANGLVMSVLWCCVIKEQSTYLSAKNLPMSISVMGLTTPIGTALNYGISALIAAVTDWRVSFWLASALMLFMSVLWFLTLSDIERSAVVKSIDNSDTNDVKTKTEVKKNSKSTATVIGIWVIFVAVMITQFTRDGLTTWVPSILYDVYNMPTTISVALTLLLPLLSSISNFVLVALEKRCRDFVILSIGFIAVSALFGIVLVTCYGLNSVVITMLCFIVMCASCSGMANLATNHVPLYYRDRFDSGVLAGVGQGFAYLGSTVSTYALGLVADKGGWYNVFLLLSIVVSVALIMCIIFKIATKEKHHHPRYI